MWGGNERTTEDNSASVEDILDPYVDAAEATFLNESSQISGREHVSATLLRLVPKSLRYRWIDVSVTTETTEIDAGDPIMFDVTITNRAPAAIPLLLTSSAVWGWYIDGYPEAEERTPYSGPPRRVSLPGSRSYTFERTWSGRFKRGEKYELPDEGKLILTARLHVDDSSSNRPSDSVEVRVHSTD